MNFSLEPSKNFSAAEVVVMLDLAPLPNEGGWFRRTYADEQCSTILYLMAAGDGFSALHKLSGAEILTFAGGEPARSLLLHPNGSSEVLTLGQDYGKRHQPQIIVPKGTWQGTATLGDWTLITATMAPPYTDESFVLGEYKNLCEHWPEHAEQIKVLTRSF